jgi:ribosomal protein S16
MTEATQAPSITLDGVSYTLDQFSQAVVQAVGVYNMIQADLQKEQLAVIKTQAALQNIGAQISEAVKKELADKAAAQEAAAVEAVPAAE